jgi:hypothetical protein
MKDNELGWSNIMATPKKDDSKDVIATIKSIIRRYNKYIIVIYMIFLIGFMFVSPIFQEMFNIPKITSQDKVTVKDDEIFKLDAKIRDVSARMEKLENKSNQKLFITPISNSSSNISREEFILLKNDVQTLNQSINKITLNNITPNLHDDNFNSLDSRLEIIETAIVDSPERSLALYKLSNDIVESRMFGLYILLLAN